MILTESNNYALKKILPDNKFRPFSKFSSTFCLHPATILGHQHVRMGRYMGETHRSYKGVSVLYTFAFKVLTKTTFIFMIFVPKKLFSDQTNNIENPAIIMQ